MVGRELKSVFEIGCCHLTGLGDGDRGGCKERLLWVSSDALVDGCRSHLSGDGQWFCP